MDMRFVLFAPKSRARRVAFAGLAAFLAVSPVARADDDCVTTTSTSAEPDFVPCPTSEPQIDVDGAIAEHTATITRSKSPVAMPWIAEPGQDVPLTVSPSDTGLGLRTSLGTWRDYNQRAASRSLDDTPLQQPGILVLPKAPAPPNAPVDLWSSIDTQGYEGSRDQSKRAGVGVDWKVAPAATLGVSAERGDARSVGSSETEQDAKMSAYVTLQAAPMISVDARTQWQAGNAEFAAANGAAEKSSVILAPKIDHSFALEGGQTLSPFVTYQREFDLSTAGRETGVDPTTAAQSAGAGVTYTKPDAFSLTVTTDVQGLGASEPESLNSRFNLSVPIR